MTLNRSPIRGTASLLDGLRTLMWLAVIAIGLAVAAPQGHAQEAPTAQTATPDFSSPGFSSVDAVINSAIQDKTLPGAVVVIGNQGHVVYRKAYGWRSLTPVRERMTMDTIFDIASLTKPVATAVSIMQMVQMGQLRLNDPVSRYIPEFTGREKDQVTIRDLLTHYSGLAEDLDLKHPWQGRETALRMAHEEELINPPGARFVYSDINYLVLGEVVERVSGLPLDVYAAKHIFAPLGMTRTAYKPPVSWRASIAPTTYDERGVMLRGIVHDPTARRMGGVAGNAGVFSTAGDLARFATALLTGGGGVLSPEAIAAMTSPQQPSSAPVLRGLGWDIDSVFSSPRGDLLPVGSYGHTGFTGTSLWIDPGSGTFIILLTNAVHPRGGEPLLSLRARLANAAASSLNLAPGPDAQLQLARITGYNDTNAAARRLTFRNGQVRTGIDVLEAHNFAELKPALEGPRRRIGLVTNHSGIDSQGRRTIDVLASAPGMELAAIFSPEHGILGEADTTANLSTVDKAAGIAVHSVYGESDASRRPPLDLLKKLDAVVFDIQDAGARFYTYESTLGYFLEASAAAGIEMIVLDRPNPITGSMVQGPLPDPDTSSFVNYHPVPVRHGMTLGELARMFNAERGIHARLTVVAMEGWMRGDWFDSTGLLWVNPSPNLRSLNAATLYPGVCLIETTNVSVGRGTDRPFEVIGAPWIKPEELAAYLNRREIQGVRFVPITLTPTSDKYAGERIGGVSIVLLDRNFFDAPELGLELASALFKLYPSNFEAAKMSRLVNNRSIMDALTKGTDPRRIAEDWRDSVNGFLQLRRKYLLY